MTGASATAAEIAAAIAAGKASASEVVQAALDRIEAGNPRINAFTAVFRDRALKAAAAVDARRARGEALGPLAGVPYAVKNLFDVKGEVTIAGSKINREHAPAKQDATAVAKLEAAGAVIVGALNMGEYAYDFTGENAHDGACRNPHDPNRMTGGSSSGSGAAVAAGLVPFALGTDTNGSIRVPSSLCGTFGLKPTYGRLSRAGAYPFAASFDHIGPLARSVADLALSYDAMQGPDPRDPAQAPRPAELALPAIDKGIAGLRIAVAGGYFASGGTPETHAAVDAVAKALGAARKVELPEAGRARAAAFIITSVEGAALHLDRLKTRQRDYDPDTRDRFLAGALVPGTWYVQAQRFRRWYRDQVAQVFREVDILLAPATPCTAPPVGEAHMAIGGQQMLVRPNLGIFTQPLSFIGLPVVAVPLRSANGLPIAVQVVAAPWHEALALCVARVLERDGLATTPVAA
ncbi:AtzE family amidohydrolase [Desertibaculum subflavum]|uniref:AtzE family amidohydrolase n=1 Tax=Desertibaculum subflavum TaxID=2268458 RepID=UPI000E664EC0